MTMPSIQKMIENMEKVPQNTDVPPISIPISLCARSISDVSDQISGGNGLREDLLLQE